MLRSLPPAAGSTLRVAWGVKPAETVL